MNQEMSLEKIGKIKNFDKLAQSDLRVNALKIAEAGLGAIDTSTAIKRDVHLDENILTIKEESFNLSKVGKLVVVGIGKCSLEAVSVLENMLGDRINDGIVMDFHSNQTLKRIRAYEGDHPFPSERNIGGTKKIIELLSNLSKEDLVLMIVSGGGSTLLCQPDNLTCQEESSIVDCLFKEGATIEEINTIRKHISYARGGYLAKYAYPAKVVSMIFSDIPGDKLEFVASGPTMKDTTTVSDAKTIIDKYDVNKKCGFNEDSLIETPKEEKYFKNVKNILLLSNEVALNAMSDKAERLGFKPTVCNTCLAGEAKIIGKKIAEDINSAPPKSVLLYGGETTVNIKGSGKGGRNQELALAGLYLMKENTLIMGLASDGKDNTDHAGALCDTITQKKATEQNLNPEKYIRENDSYNFFEKTGDFINTGTTGSNVSDLVIAIKN